MENIALFDMKIYADTPQMARLSSGFLLKEMLERFSQKIDLALKPDRTLWFYSTHFFIMTNLLNSLGLLQVSSDLIKCNFIKFNFFLSILKATHASICC